MNNVYSFIGNIVLSQTQSYTIYEDCVNGLVRSLVMNSTSNFAIIGITRGLFGT